MHTLAHRGREWDSPKPLTALEPLFAFLLGKEITPQDRPVPEHGEIANILKYLSLGGTNHQDKFVLQMLIKNSVYCHRLWHQI